LTVTWSVTLSAPPAIAAAFDITALASAKDWHQLFANTQLQDIAGVVLTILLGLALLTWLLLITLLESANERNFNFESNQYLHSKTRFFHWCSGTVAVVLLFALHLFPFLFPASVKLWST